MIKLEDLTFNNPFEIKITNPELLAAEGLHPSTTTSRKPQSSHKIALVVDTNVLLKQTKLRQMLNVPDQNTFDELYDVVTLDEVIKEVKDEQARKYIETGLDY
jgi:hypothetical protein